MICKCKRNCKKCSCYKEQLCSGGCKKEPDPRMCKACKNYKEETTDKFSQL